MNFYSTIDKWIDGGKPLNSFVCGDCEIGMQHLSENEFDLCICDPPYGKNIGVEVGGQSHLVRMGGERLSRPKFTGDLMIVESPKRNILLN